MLGTSYYLMITVKCNMIVLAIALTDLFLNIGGFIGSGPRNYTRVCETSLE